MINQKLAKADFPPMPMSFHGPLQLRRDVDLNTAQSAIDAVDSFSRRIDVLARQLNCLGYFDEDSDRPKAA